ncbi:MAG: adenine phosphoribosyltransferase [Clostridia bacterium]|nr:adenine phosphoribosyltransferase [Clostridia bacterium]
MVYTMCIAGLSRDLKICPLNENLSIAGFIMFGDVELTEACAAALLKKAPAFDVLITAESKGIPLAYEMARQAGMNRWLLARKGIKAYMSNVVKHEVTSITTSHKQTLYLDGDDAAYMKGKRVLVVDDVISTGESLEALCSLVRASGGEIVGMMTVLAEGEAQERKDITYLEKLPLFHPDGTPIE